MSNETTSNLKSKSSWSNIKEAPADPILGVNEDFKKDTFPNKVNISVGAYRDDNGNPYILKSVNKSIEKYIKDKVNHEYLPIGGDPEFCQLAIRLAYKDDFKYLNRIASIQTISGSGALRIGQKFLYEFYPYKKKIFFSGPTWGNHLAIAGGTGLELGEYRYYDYKNKCIDFEGMCEDLEKMEDQPIVLFHACAHNPTGSDLTHEQWEKVLKIVIKKGILPFFDLAYQGFASGDLDEDAFSVRLFANAGINMILAHSFAKNMGLYGERVGCLSVLTQNEEEKKAVQTNLHIMVRTEYSSPPKFGEVIIKNILSDETLRKEWIEEVKMMAKRIINIRKALKDKLTQLGSKFNWDFITNQKGMFSFTGLSPEQCDRLKKEFHIYLIRNGRISVAGINSHNVEYIAKAFHEVTKDN